MGTTISFVEASMKSAFFFIMSFVLLTTSILRADLTTGLIAYYPFNGNANDESGLGNDGTVHGATLTIDRFGNSDSAYSFDGENDYIRIPDDPQLDGMDALTLSVWINTNDSDQWAEIINKYVHGGTHLDESYNIGIDGGPLPVFQYATEDAYVIKISSVETPIDSWHHIVGVYTGTEGSIFINGSRVGFSRNDPDPGGPVNSISEDLLIGCGNASGTLAAFYSGIIDDVRIYNRALSDSEVYDLYVVPLPSAFILGSIGIGFAGLKFRKKTQEY